MRFIDDAVGETLEATCELERRGFVEINDGQLYPTERGAVAFFLGVARDPFVREYAVIELAEGRTVESGLVLASLIAFQAEGGLEHLLDPLSAAPITEDEKTLVAGLFGRPLFDE